MLLQIFQSTVQNVLRGPHSSQYQNYAARLRPISTPNSTSLSTHPLHHTLLFQQPRMDEKIKAAQNALAFSFGQDEAHYKEWLMTRPGRIKYIAHKTGRTEEEESVIQVQRNIFLNQVKSFEDIDPQFVKADLEKAFDDWLTSLTLDREIVKNHLDVLQHRFNDTITSMQDTWEPDQRDRDAKSACERYRDDPKEEYFEDWLSVHQNLYVQANAKTLHPMKTQLKLEFGNWCKCPWKVDNIIDFIKYLIKYPTGPSGFDNSKWANDMMKLFYLNTPEAWMVINMRDPDRAHDMAKSLPDISQDVPTVLEDLDNYSPGTPDYPADPPAAQDLQKKLQELQEQQEALKQQIALQNEKQINQQLKGTFETLAKEVAKKRSFQRMSDWRKALKGLPPTKKAKAFKDTCIKAIKDAQAREQEAVQARATGREKLIQQVEAYFK